MKIYIVAMLVLVITACDNINNSAFQSTLLEVDGKGIVPDFVIDNLYGWEVETETVESAKQEGILYLDCNDEQADDPVFSLVSLEVNTAPIDDATTPEQFIKEYYELNVFDDASPLAVKPVSFTHEKGWTYRDEYSIDFTSIVDVYFFKAGNTMFIVNATSTEDLHDSHSVPKFEAMLNTFDIK